MFSYNSIINRSIFQPISQDKKTGKRRKVFIFFDFETRQDVVVEQTLLGPVMKHVPNMCIAYRLCDECRNKDLGVCSSCGVNRHCFKGDACLDNFGKWLFSEENRNVTAMAHNARGFDSQFLLEYLHRQRTVRPKKIVNRGNL